MILYIIVSAALVALTVAGLLVYNSAKASQQADAKADQFIAALASAGARTPTHDQVVRVLGDDGGAVCANPGHALPRATLFSMLANGAGGPGTRPIIADSRLLKGQLLILQVYCPDKLASFQQLASQLKSANVAGG
jgi:hypothetical protein